MHMNWIDNRKAKPMRVLRLEAARSAVSFVVYRLQYLVLLSSTESGLHRTLNDFAVTCDITV